MVLSNKKLKQKLREAKSELLSAKAQTPATVNSSKTPNSESQESAKSLLDSAAQKAKLSKTKKRKRKVLSLKENDDEVKAVSNVDDEIEGIDGLDDATKKIKKRKIDDEEMEVEEKEEMKKMKMKMKMKKNKKKKKKKAKAKVNKKVKMEIEGAEETVANGNEVSENHVIQETTNHIIQETNQAANNEASLDDCMKVYVGGIPYYSTEDDIRSYFESCGTITEIDCMKFPESGKFRGIAIISFMTEAAAKRALALDGSDMGGLFLKIQPYKSGRTTVKAPGFSPALVEGYNRIYVGNLAWDITEDDLKKTFSNCNIKSIRFGEDKETSEFRGYAHVDFSDSLSLNNALKLDQTVVLGRPVRISAAVPKKASDKKSESNGKSNLSGPGTESGVKSQPLPADGKESGIKSQPSDGKESGVKSQPLPADGKESGVKSQPLPAGFGGEENVSGKIRRRTCYECGERGHLSSACPKSAPVKESGGESHSAAPANGGESHPMPETAAPPNFGGEENVSGKIRRRTCYECGERGHLSSACPKSAPVKKSGGESQPTPVDGGESQHMPDTSAPANFGGEENVSGKIRRRTCYECGERGHLSSACPKSAPGKESGGQSHSTPVSAAPMPKTTVPADDGGVASGKIRRRTCYECGERGHLSSSCPKKLSSDQIVSVSS